MIGIDLLFELNNNSCDLEQLHEDNKHSKLPKVKTMENIIYTYPIGYIHPKEVVLCRDDVDSEWTLDVFKSYNPKNPIYPFRCYSHHWGYCIPYEGNDYLFKTTGTPKKPNINMLFGIRLKPGYVFEFKNGTIGVVFPTYKGLAISYINGNWQYINDLDKNNIICIRGLPYQENLLSGCILWKLENNN